MDRITAEMLNQHGPIVKKLFQAAYPDGLDPDALRVEAGKHGYLRRMLAALEGERA